MPSARSPSTLAFDEFERTLKGLNDFYWVLRASCALVGADSSPSDRLKVRIDLIIANHIDLTVDELLTRVATAERYARNSVLVHAITAYEEYLSKALNGLVSKSIKPEKQYAVRLRLADVPSTMTHADLAVLVAAHEVRSVVDARYSERTVRVRKLLTEHGKKVVPLANGEAALIAQACEARHCIVHCGGMADARAVSELSSAFPGLAVDDELPLDESALWKFLGALRAGARSIHQALNPTRTVKRGRAASRRKKRTAPKVE